MLDYSTIRQLQEDAARKAKRQGLKPYDVRKLDLSRVPPFPFPNFGTYVPKGWVKYTDADGDWVTLFCDSSGFGSPGEPALTIDELIERLRNLKLAGDPIGIAIVEEGQFQVVLGLFKPDPRDFTRTGELTDLELTRVGGS